MSRKFLQFALLLFLFFFILADGHSQKVRIACVGNSITYGAGMVNREKNNFPQQLQHILGNKYDVMNFGVNGATLLKKGNYPYWNTPQYRRALGSKPDIVFIKLGTNDSKAVNRTFHDHFRNDFKDLIDSFRRLPTHPRIILLLPLPSFLEDSNSIYNPVIKEKIIPFIQDVAYQTNTEVIDLYSLFVNDPGLFPDKIHPSSNGASLIARRLYEAVTMKKLGRFNVFEKVNEPKKISSFYGYEMADFSFNGRGCKIVKPKNVASGLPWVWRARFWGHEPQTDIALLERGFHVVYCDVAELYGNKEAIAIWNKFYEFLQTMGFSKKPALEGMSRGGIYIYNWALANPTKVACIYADAPVLDLKSWPGGKGKGPGSVQDWEILKKDYSLNDSAANSFSNSPLDNASKIAKLGIPLLHVVGDNDEVVPVDENTGPFARRIEEAGGNIKVIHKPGIGHHPHSLANPTPIVDFILRSTGMKTNFAVVAVPGAEYRSAAGWIEGKDWWAQHENIDSLLLAEKKVEIIFIGNSITQGIGGKRTSVTYKPGLGIFDSVFSAYHWVCAGISGDRTQNVLWRVQNGNYIKAKPRLVVITIGVNNFNEEDSPAEIVSGMMAIVKYIHSQSPSTQIILSGLLPTGLQKDSDRRKKYDSIHQILAKQKPDGYIYFPLTNTYVQTDGSLSLLDFSADGIHLEIGGYRKWARALFPVIEKLLANNNQ